MIWWLDIFFSLDKYLDSLIAILGSKIYLLLFLVVFLEMGIIILPFLPGDSLVFACGAFAARGSLNVVLLFFALAIGAILGDLLNYLIGNLIGKTLIKKYNVVSKRNLDRTHEFYAEYGAKTVVLARFVPIIRLIAPFVAGIGKMNLKKFMFYNIVGGLVWVAIFLTIGFFFGTIPFVQKHFSVVILAIVFISALPVLTEWLKYRREKQN